MTDELTYDNVGSFMANAVVQIGLPVLVAQKLISTIMEIDYSKEPKKKKMNQKEIDRIYWRG